MASKFKIEKTLEAIDLVVLGASNSTASIVKKRAEGQRWVMMNVTMGMNWDAPSWIKRFGRYTELPLTEGYGNPRILKMYYFPSIDMTLMVNVLKGEIDVWRMGKQYS